MRSNDLLLYFPLSFEPIFAPQKIRALEQWRSGAVRGATMRSTDLLLYFLYLS